MERIWLDVPFDKKDKAKAAGAKWDRAARRWYASREGIAALKPWKSQPSVRNVLPGEDRAFGSGLFIDMVPKSGWFTNVRSCIDGRDWERLRRMVTSRAGNRCEICGMGPDKERQILMEAHERWSYDGVSKIQKLQRLICLCTSCHSATHYGFAQINGYEEQVLAHLMKINNWNKTTAKVHVRSATQIWQFRCMSTWTLDLSILTGAGVTVVRPPNASGRSDVAKNQTEAVRRQERLR